MDEDAVLKTVSRETRFVGSIPTASANSPLAQLAEALVLGTR
jgi:hypothetical protein